MQNVDARLSGERTWGCWVVRVIRGEEGEIPDGFLPVEDHSSSTQYQLEICGTLCAQPKFTSWYLVGLCFPCLSQISLQAADQSPFTNEKRPISACLCPCPTIKPNPSDIMKQPPTMLLILANHNTLCQYECSFTVRSC